MVDKPTSQIIQERKVESEDEGEDPLPKTEHISVTFIPLEYEKLMVFRAHLILLSNNFLNFIEVDFVFSEYCFIKKQ